MDTELVKVRLEGRAYDELHTISASKRCSPADYIKELIGRAVAAATGVP